MTQNSAALRLAKYLKEFVGLRSTTVRDVTKYEHVLWFGDMPQEPDCRSPAWADDHDPGEPWLEVKKQQFERAPTPPTMVLPWADENMLGRATPNLPGLRSTIFLPDLDADLADGESPPLVQRALQDYPEVQQAYERYRPAWEAWSTEFRRREAIQAIYADLFRLHTQVRKQGEIVEVVLGLGLLEWRLKANGGSVRIRRHSVVARAEVEFEPAKGVIRVVSPSDGARLQIEDDMLDAPFRPDRTHYATVSEQLKEVGDEIWDKARMHNALKVWAGALSADSKWSPGLGARRADESDPVMSFAPALILRKRAQSGMVRIYQMLIDQLSDESIEVPQGWGGLIADVGDLLPEIGARDDSERKSAPQAPVELYFPLPANREQRQIVDAIDSQRGVLVQGPPGTGKSHTIANLICHLLATGKRVLITAETGRALQVLKDKLPIEVQPLCISLLGQSGDSLAELNKSVQGITTRQAAYTPGAYDSRIIEIDRELDQERRQLAETDSEIRGLREEETHPHQVADGVYHGSASTIAERVAKESSDYGWLRLSGDAGATLPLTNNALVDWLAILRRYSELEISESCLEIPSSLSLPGPREFATAVAAELSAATAVKRNEKFRSHVAYASIGALSIELREWVGVELRKIETQRLILGRTATQWQNNAIIDLVAGRRARWGALIEQTKAHLAKMERLNALIGEQLLTYPKDRDPRRVRADSMVAVSHFSAGGKWKTFGLFTPKVLAECGYLRKDVLIDGKAASDGESLQAVCDHLDFELALGELQSTWSAVGAPPVGGDRRMRSAQFRELLASLQQCDRYAKVCQDVGQFMLSATPPIPEPSWLDGQVSEWLQLIDAAADEDSYQAAARTVNVALQELNIICAMPNAHPVCFAIREQVQSRDVNAYGLAFEQIVAIEATRVALERRCKTESVLATVTPSLIKEVSGSCENPEWDQRFAGWEQAWHWAIADAWLQKRSDFGYQQKLWQRRRQIDQRIGQLLAEAASLRAWTHFFSRLSQRESAALKGWRETVRAMGKGTGQSAKMARLREEARRYMDACRDAIPVWIMPRYLVAEMVDPTPNRYDLVIVDEASQLGIESLFLFYISEKMVVVGDDQQISPYGVGIDNEAIADLQHHYLVGIPHQGSLSAQSSLYGNAKIRFNKNVVLREHFRCMPEIIQFSNDLCYASNGTPLDPLRAYPADRLQPLVLRHVADGYRTGSTQNAQNLPEADAIVAQIVSCIEDPRYVGATMGVISLQGEAQAKLIERKLLEHLDPAVIEARRLICGDAYAFQGDEREIIFLSMVAAAGEKRIGVLATESARQRFNVAVSRARDQLWLFHSATLDVLSDACMRHRLLSYMLNPVRQVSDEGVQHFDSEFERHVFRLITERGFHVRTQVCIGDPTNHRYRIDLVVEGMKGRLAVECDGDKWHGPERYEHDMARQRDLERAGWEFARIRGGDFYRDPEAAMQSVWDELERLGIRPGGIGIGNAASEPPIPVRSEALAGSGALIDESAEPPMEQEEPESVTPSSEPELKGDSAVEPHEPPVPNPVASTPVREPHLHTATLGTAPAQLELSTERGGSNGHSSAYVAFDGESGPDPRYADLSKVARGLCRVIEVEGPMLAKRAYDTYLRGCGVRRMGGELKKMMNKALQHAVRNGDILAEDESGRGGLLHSVVRSKGAPPVLVRDRGPREFEEIPASELQLVARLLARDNDMDPGSDEHLRAVLEFFELKRLTVQVGTTLLDILARKYPYVDQIFERNPEHAA